MRNSICVAWLCCLIPVSAIAQQANAPGSQAAAQPRHPALLAKDAQGNHPLSLSRADVAVLVDGAVARTTLTLTFSNDANRVLEGELTFPLPEGASVSGYGLDVNGQMVDGVAVEKQKARQSYEREVHMGIDPGLLEHVAGNNFRTRVYPIPAHGSRTVRVQYENNLFSSGDGLAYVVPLNWDEEVAACKVKIEVLNAADKPTVKSKTFAGIVFEPRAGGGFVAQKQFEHAQLNDDLSLAMQTPGDTVRIESRPRFAVTSDDLAKPINPSPEFYFAISNRPAVPPATAPGAVVKKTSRIGVLWDASMSRRSIDHAREIAVLKAAMKQMGNGDVDLVLFRNVAEPARSFTVRNGQSDELIKYIASIGYDGGTNLGALAMPANPRDLFPRDEGQLRGDYGYWLLFSDGLGDIGPSAPAAAEAPVYVVSNDDRANHALLDQIARKSGGAYLNLKRLDDAQAAAIVGRPPYSLIKAVYDARQIADVTPSGAQPAGGRVLVCGKLLAPEARITLQYGYGSNVLASQTYMLRQTDAKTGGLLPEIWAQQKIAELSALPDDNHDELLRLGREFNMATPATSLLVLETADQYARNDVVPPRNRPAVYQEFLAKVREKKALAQKTHEQRVQAALAMWDERVKWWEKKYDYPANFTYSAPAVPVTLPPGLAAADASGTSGPATQPANGGVSQRDFAGLTRGESEAGQAARPAASPPAGARSRLSAADERAVPRRGAQAQNQWRALGDVDGRDVTTNHAPSDNGIRERAGEITVRGRDAGGEPSASPALTQQLQQALREDEGRGPSGAVYGNGRNSHTGKKDKEITLLDATGEGEASIQIKTWDPRTPYLKAMKAAGPEKAYAVFLEQRKTFGDSPAFYLDCGDYLLRNNQRMLGIRVLSDIAELQLEDARLLRIVAHRLQQIGEREMAIDLFGKIARLRPDEPQSLRDLALALAAKAGDESKDPHSYRAFSDYTHALSLLNEVIMGDWQRFDGIQVVALMEYNRNLQKLKNMPGVHDISSSLDPRLVKLLDCDVRIVMTWDTDNTDIDLWVTEPSGEKCFYQHNRTTIGGMLSRDFTDGYGPEEYCVRKAMPGQYKIQANFFGSRQQALVGPTTVHATVITNFGRPDEKRQSMTLRLTDNKQVVDVGSVKVGG